MDIKITGFRERLFGYGFATILLGIAVIAYQMELYTLRDWEPYVLYGSLIATVYMVVHESRKKNPAILMQDDGLSFVNLGDGQYNNVNNISMLVHEKKVLLEGGTTAKVARNAIEKIVVAGLPHFANDSYNNTGVQETIALINTRSPAPLSTYYSSYVFYIVQHDGQHIAFDARFFRKSPLQHFCQQLNSRGFPIESHL